MSRRIVAVTVVVLVGAVAAGMVLFVARGRRADAARSSSSGAVPTSTAQVTRTDLATSQQVTGALTFSGAQMLVDQRQGIAFTALPSIGQVLDRGAPVYEVDGVTIPLFFGARPMWRDLTAGITDGPDVRQLEDNLVALGYATTDQVGIDEHFNAATTQAIKRWQRATGREATGTFATGDAVWADGPLRLSSIDIALGAPARPGTVVAHATSTRHVVSLDLPVSQINLLKRGDPVSVQLPDGTRAAGKLTEIVPVAAQQSGGNGRQPLSVEATVNLDDPNAGAAFDAAPVTVDITQSSVRGVLAVPINALVAPADGGFAVEVVDGGNHRLVAVHTGVFSRTMVEVSGEGIAEGTTVVVPAP